MANKSHHMTAKYGGKSGRYSAQIETLKDNIDDVVNSAVLALYSNLVKDTPVGNPSLWKTKYPPKGYVGGMARANWQIVEIPNDEVMYSTSNAATPKLPNQWSKLYIINNVPYIVPLEYGHSTQVSTGWIRTNVDRFQQFLEEAKNQRLK